MERFKLFLDYRAPSLARPANGRVCGQITNSEKVAMRFGILCGGTGWHVQDLLRAARELGHSAEPVDFRTLAATLPPVLSGFDAYVARMMPAGSLEQIIFRMDCLHASTIPVFNPPRSLETCVDKFLTSVRLTAAGIVTPRTICCQSSDVALEAFEKLGGDVVVKPIFGSEGRGMVRITDLEIAWRTLRAIEQSGGILYLQEFVDHPGWDLRAFVVGERILAAMKRTGHGDWRTNVAQGGTTEPFRLNAELETLALAAARATGAWIAGVDLIRDSGGNWLVIEVNAVPGWKALAETCGIDVATEVVRSVAEAIR